MKKNIVRIFAAMLALCFTLTLTACTGGNNQSSGTESSSLESSAVDSQTESSEQEAEDSTISDVEEAQKEALEQQEKEEEAVSDAMENVSGKYASIDEFLSSQDIQSQLDAMQTDELGVTITAEDNKLVYTYTFAEGIETDGAAEALETGIQSQASTFQSIAATLALVVDVENPVVVVRYLDYQGNEIYSTEFTAE